MYLCSQKWQYKQCIFNCPGATLSVWLEREAGITNIFVFGSWCTLDFKCSSCAHASADTLGNQIQDIYYCHAYVTQNYPRSPRVDGIFLSGLYVAINEMNRNGKSKSFTHLLTVEQTGYKAIFDRYYVYFIYYVFTYIFVGIACRLYCIILHELLFLIHPLCS